MPLEPLFNANQYDLSASWLCSLRHDSQPGTPTILFFWASAGASPLWTHTVG